MASRSDVKPHVLHVILRESSELQLWDRIDRITCPVLILRGGLPGSMLTEEAAEQYQKRLQDSRVIVFGDSGHNLSQPDFERFIGTIKTFPEELDSSKKASIGLREAF